MSLLEYACNEHTQSGEDGIFAHLFNVIGTTSRMCCEFGAWDGLHFSNSRTLLLNGWSGVLIEADPIRFAALKQTYADRPDVHCLHAMVDAGNNRLGRLFARAEVATMLDLLSIDIDGPDYEVLAAVDFSPRVLCVEVSAGHSPTNQIMIERSVAKRNIGQPLWVFCQKAKTMGYRLICYTGNAIFLRTDLGFEANFPTLTPVEAYEQFLSRLSRSARDWLYLVNKGLVEPFYPHANPYLARQALQIGAIRSTRLQFQAAVAYYFHRLASAPSRCNTSRGSLRKFKL